MKAKQMNYTCPVGSSEEIYRLDGIEKGRLGRRMTARNVWNAKKGKSRE